jgi:hypothetical protein
MGREGEPLIGIAPHTPYPPHIHSLWINVWRKGPTMLGRQTDHNDGFRTTGVEVEMCRS